MSNGGIAYNIPQTLPQYQYTVVVVGSGKTQEIRQYLCYHNSETTFKIFSKVNTNKWVCEELDIAKD